MTMAWGARVSSTFRDRAKWIADELGFDVSDLMACMAFETGETFSASITNAAGSGAVGLIQFMPQTAFLLDTSSEALARMTPENQLNYVYKYFKPYKGRLHNLGDLYMAILWPAGIGKPDSWNLFERGGPHPSLYLQNKGLDFDRDGDVSRGEALRAVRAKLAKGLLPGNAG